MNKDACENGINVTPQTVRYSVTGMTCAACQAHVEKAVSGVDGVTSCAVSLLTASMSVEGNADPSDVIEAVTNYAFENSDTVTIEAAIRPDNIKSLRCIEKAGYEFDRIAEREDDDPKSKKLIYICRKEQASGETEVD